MDPSDTSTAVASGHENDVNAPAPGDLELVRSFLSLHDHGPGDDLSVPPSPATMAGWFLRRGLATARDAGDEGSIARALELHAALRDLVARADDPSPSSLRVLDDAASAARVAPRFSRDRLEPGVGGIPGALGRLLAIAFTARMDGSWDRLHTCSSPTCASVFYDHSKNRSGRWCSMRSCGNQAKVRAYRARQREPGA